VAIDPDKTITVRRSGRKSATRRVRLIALAGGLLLSGAAAWMLWSGRTPQIPTTITQTAPVTPAVQPALPPMASEAVILARAPESTEAYRFALAPSIFVLQFPSLAEQASTLNRVAAWLEKLGFPRDRLLGTAELEQRIRASGDTPETFYSGHDYRATDLLGFFAEADRAGTALTSGETSLRRMMAEWGWRAGTNAALITLVRRDDAAGLDVAARATILRHELSHGLYFTSPDYAHYAAQFWADALSHDERDRFRRFLAGEGYDTGIDDLVINETQAYLMHTADRRFFNAAAVGIPERRLDVLRTLFLLGMPPGWLRDCTAVPPKAP
jgi:hypothetical protein